MADVQRSSKYSGAMVLIQLGTHVQRDLQAPAAFRSVCVAKRGAACQPSPPNIRTHTMRVRSLSLALLPAICSWSSRARDRRTQTTCLPSIRRDARRARYCFRCCSRCCTTTWRLLACSNQSITPARPRSLARNRKRDNQRQSTSTSTQWCRRLIQSRLIAAYNKRELESTRCLESERRRAFGAASCY